MRVIDTIDAVLELKGTHVWSISPDATVFQAIGIMSEKNIGALLVMSAGKLAGVFTERDYTRKVALHGRSSKDTLVGEVVSERLIAATPHDTIEACMRLMTDNRIRHLPVLIGDRVVGIVSIGDLVNWIIRAQTHTIEQLESYVTGQYPG